MMNTKQVLHKLGFEITLKYHQVALLMVWGKKIERISYISTANTHSGLVGLSKWSEKPQNFIQSLAKIEKTSK